MEMIRLVELVYVAKDGRRFRVKDTTGKDPNMVFYRARDVDAALRHLAEEIKKVLPEG